MLNFDNAINKGVESVRKVFPESGCRETCLKAQLAEHYEKYKDCNLEVNSGKGGSKSKTKGGKNK